MTNLNPFKYTIFFTGFHGSWLYVDSGPASLLTPAATIIITISHIVITVVITAYYGLCFFLSLSA